MPPADEWIKKMWYIYTMEYYCAIKKNKIMPFAATQRGSHTERSKSERERQTPYDITYMWTLKHGTNESFYKTETDHEQGEQTCGCPGIRKRKWDG